MKARLPEPWKIWYFIMLFAIFKPGYLPNKALLYLFYGLEAISLVYLIFATLWEKQFNFDLLILIAVYYLILSFSTILNSGDLPSLFEEILTSSLVILWFHLASRRDSKACLNMLLLVFEYLIYINLITLLLFPQGLYRSADAVVDARYGWFLGHQSLLSMYVGPAICVAAIYSSNNKDILHRFRALILVVACVLEVVIMGSANNIICISVIALGTIVMCLIRMKEFPFALVYIGVAFLILIISVFQATAFMEPFVTKYLHRSMTFTNRTFVWIKYLSAFKDNWLLGNGVQSDSILQKQFSATHAHNQYIQCLYLGGIVLFIAFCFICFRSFKNLKKYAGTIAGRVMLSAIVALMFQMIFETYFHHTMGKVLIVLSFYFNQLFELRPETDRNKRRKRKWKTSEELCSAPKDPIKDPLAEQPV